METFASYILGEPDYIKKIEIVYFLHKKTKIFFDNSVILKTELARMFIEEMNLNVNKNLVITACLLYACKKNNDPTDLSKVKSYAKEGATYLKSLGFSDRFCKICEEVNRYNEHDVREPEGDILELVDNFGGLLMNRPERKGFCIDEALILLKERNLKHYENRYLEQFIEFVEIEEGITV